MRACVKEREREREREIECVCVSQRENVCVLEIDTETCIRNDHACTSAAYFYAPTYAPALLRRRHINGRCNAVFICIFTCARISMRAWHTYVHVLTLSSGFVYSLRDLGPRNADHYTFTDLTKM